MIAAEVTGLARSAHALIIDLGTFPALDAPQFRSALLAPRLDVVPTNGGWNSTGAITALSRWKVHAGTMNLSADADLDDVDGYSIGLGADTALALVQPDSDPYAAFAPQRFPSTAPLGETVSWGGALARSGNMAALGDRDIHMLASLSDTYASGRAIDGSGSFELARSAVLADDGDGLSFGDRLHLGTRVDLATRRAFALGAGGGITASLGGQCALYGDYSYSASLPVGDLRSQTVSAGLAYQF